MTKETKALKDKLRELAEMLNHAQSLGGEIERFSPKVREMCNFLLDCKGLQESIRDIAVSVGRWYKDPGILTGED